ncbi:uncharacterized protein L203_104148 [Cryptococcus depauperatus CBS 7841]|uniref:CCHC-type domain-containing protein n=1 Tax=Cryptococcus depauperatus CBS 7841 TaxID=1295531 RepID=A0AAJ8M299_9TREE
MENSAFQEQLEMMKRLQVEMERMRVQQEELKEENKTLKNEIKSMIVKEEYKKEKENQEKVEVPTAVIPSSGKRVVTPERFDGSNPAALNHFLFQCRSEFLQNSSSYPSEESKVHFATNHLAGSVAETVVIYLQGDACPWESDFDAFAKFLVNGWGNPIKRQLARQKLQNIRQNARTAKEFFLEFDKYRAMVSDCPLDIIIGFAEKALRVEVLENMAIKEAEDWETFEEFREEAIKVDEHRRKIENLKKRITVGIRSTALCYLNKTPLLSVGEKAWRKNNNRCLRCRAPGHIAQFCPSAMNQVRHVQLEKGEEQDVEK